MHELHEFNPMLGFRGCRLGIIYPEISEMQARAIFEAAAEVQKEGIKVKPEVMIPLVGFKTELDLQVEIVHRVAAEVMKETGKEVQVPGRHDDRSAARRADRRRDRRDGRVLQLRHQRPDANRLGMSRDDSGSFLPSYQEQEIIKSESVRHRSTRTASAS